MASEKPPKPTMYDDYANRVKVLLVEDSPTDAQLLRESLEDYPLQQFEIAHAQRLDEALGRLTQESFDVILLDLDLPDSIGMQTCERISNAAGQAPIIVLTGADEETTAGEAMLLGVQDYLVKGQTSGSVIGRVIRYAVERDRSQRALRENEAQFRAFFHNAAVGTAQLALDGRFVAANDCYCRIVGYSREELLTMTPTDLSVPEDRQRDHEYLAQFLQGHLPAYDIEKRYVRKDGRIIWVHVTAGMIRDASGRPVCSAGIIEDITDRKQAEKGLQKANEHLQQQTEELQRQKEELADANAALRESEERQRRLIENLKGSHFIYVHDTKGVFQYVSELVTGVLGYTPEEFMTHYSKYLTDHPVNQAVYRHTELSIQGIHQPPYEVNTWHKDGSTRWLEVQEVPVSDAAGKVIAVEGVAQDITERKRAEEALRESEERHRFLVESVNDWIWEVDQNAVYTYSSPQCREMLGYEPEEIVGKTPYDLMPPDEGRRIREIFVSLAGQAKPFRRLENVNRRKDGRLVVMETNGVPVLDAQGKLAGYRGMDRDITERKRAEEALHNLNATLESRVVQRTAELERRTRQLQKLALELSQAEERERKRLAEILHDDLQQQLAAAKFHLGLLGHRVKGDASLHEATAQVEGMVKDAIAKSRSLSHELSPAMLYHGDFVEAIEWLANQIQTKHGLVVHVEVQGPIEVSSDSIKAFLFRAAQEILFNIVKHAKVTEATVRLQRRREQVWLSIWDRGRGFDPKALGQTGGFGLLSIRERVELLGGRMKIRSAPGRGSVFLITVPNGQTTEDTGPRTEDRLEPSAAVRAPSAAGVLRVLLVDDHEVMREGLALLLDEQEDIEVVGQAANGREAVELAYELQPDVVVMDVAMPLMGGDEATRRIKRAMPGTRVVGLSMFEEPALVERMHRAGAERYMLKTAPSEELLVAIRGRESTL